MPTYVLLFIGPRGGRQRREVFAEDSTDAEKEGRRQHAELFARMGVVDISRKAQGTPWNKPDGFEVTL